MSELTTVSFLITREMKYRLKQWASESDRSVSYIIRQILEKETQRRTAAEDQRREATDQCRQIETH